jgi:hypothetical protein
MRIIGIAFLTKSHTSFRIVDGISTTMRSQSVSIQYISLLRKPSKSFDISYAAYAQILYALKRIVNQVRFKKK